MLPTIQHILMTFFGDKWGAIDQLEKQVVASREEQLEIDNTVLHLIKFS